MTVVLVLAIAAWVVYTLASIAREEHRAGLERIRRDGGLR